MALFRFSASLLAVSNPEGSIGPITASALRPTNNNNDFTVELSREDPPGSFVPFFRDSKMQIPRSPSTSTVGGLLDVLKEKLFNNSSRLLNPGHEAVKLLVFAPRREVFVGEGLELLNPEADATAPIHGKKVVLVLKEREEREANSSSESIADSLVMQFASPGDELFSSSGHESSSDSRNSDDDEMMMDQSFRHVVPEPSAEPDIVANNTVVPSMRIRVVMVDEESGSMRQVQDWRTFPAQTVREGMGQMVDFMERNNEAAMSQLELSTSATDRSWDMEEPEAEESTLHLNSRASNVSQNMSSLLSGGSVLLDGSMVSMADGSLDHGVTPHESGHMLSVTMCMPKRSSSSSGGRRTSSAGGSRRGDSILSTTFVSSENNPGSSNRGSVASRPSLISRPSITSRASRASWLGDESSLEVGTPGVSLLLSPLPAVISSSTAASSRSPPAAIDMARFLERSHPEGCSSALPPARRVGGRSGLLHGAAAAAGSPTPSSAKSESSGASSDPRRRRSSNASRGGC